MFLSIFASAAHKPRIRLVDRRHRRTVFSRYFAVHLSRHPPALFFFIIIFGKIFDHALFSEISWDIAR